MDPTELRSPTFSREDRTVQFPEHYALFGIPDAKLSLILSVSEEQLKGTNG
jgi:hypothetical protein